jgi:glycosyltransferase involved in cell wall biosynthesis
MATMATEQPLVSVIIPTYNRSSLLPRAIRSVLGQTYTNLECIVIDDASTDDTASAVQQFTDDRLVYFRHETNRHVSAARNTGIAEAKGDLIAFLDDDDRWLPTKLEHQVPYLANLPPSVGMIYCWMDYYDDQGQMVHQHHPAYRGQVFPHVLDAQRIGGCPTLLVRRAVIEKVGDFDESLRRGNDGDFIRRVSLEYDVDFVAEALVEVNVGHGHERISWNNERGIRDAIKGHSIKLIKFKDVLHKYPRQAATINANIAYHYGQLGDWRNSFHFYWRALTTSPRSARIYGFALQSLKERITGSKHP